ncbi:ORF33 [Retroperitoneal fibromatosis-associated herpesvirus]|uniref:ORF33 n=1 Tax=Retroperitoneal fibromatosis-associated herpesvirus TaxID=111469 RepID=U5NID7_9GAMA|nr:ORF33 [Retroperitoneal fibromatosis-associated herpesvirus]AGY30715.1 ORF33 [Retroperitoneal fibromatosis-associated herpesvirus]
MSSRQRRLLRGFLNRECIWVRNPASTTHIKIFDACTAISPVFDPMVVTAQGLSYTAFHVAVAVLNHRVLGPCVAVGLNGEILKFVRCRCVSVRDVPGRSGVFLIFFGKFTDEVVGMRFPYLTAPPARENVPEITRHEIIYTSSVISRADVAKATEGLHFDVINPFVWFGGGSVWLLFLSVDYMVFCPAVEGIPSLARVFTLLTRCDREGCDYCEGLGGHVNVFKGYCAQHDPGHSGACPCIRPCTLSEGAVEISGHRNFLGLLFDPATQARITALNVTASLTPTHVENVVTGILDNGTEVEPARAPWVLLRMSDYFSRVLLIGCKRMKALALRSY